MEITIELETCKIICHIEKATQYAVFISKYNGETVQMTVPELIAELRKFAARKGVSHA